MFLGWNFVKKETLAQVFSREFCEISKNTFFTEHIWVTASESKTIMKVLVKARHTTKPRTPEHGTKEYGTAEHWRNTGGTLAEH